MWRPYSWISIEQNQLCILKHSQMSLRDIRMTVQDPYPIAWVNDGYVEARFPVLSCWCDLTLMGWEPEKQAGYFIPLALWFWDNKREVKVLYWGTLLLWELTEFTNSFSADEFVTTSLGLIWAVQQKWKSQYSICSSLTFWWPCLWLWINKVMEKQNGPNSNHLFSICNVSLKTLIQAFLLPMKRSPLNAVVAEILPDCM